MGRVGRSLGGLNAANPASWRRTAPQRRMYPLIASLALQRVLLVRPPRAIAGASCLPRRWIAEGLVARRAAHFKGVQSRSCALPPFLWVPFAQSRRVGDWVTSLCLEPGRNWLGLAQIVCMGWPPRPHRPPHLTPLTGLTECGGGAEWRSYCRLYSEQFQ